jgi:hypothetical protein
VITEHWSVFQVLIKIKFQKQKNSLQKKLLKKRTDNTSFRKSRKWIKKLKIKKSIEVIGNVIDTDLFSISVKKKQNLFFYTFQI